MSRALAAPGPGAAPLVEASGPTAGERTALGVALAAHLLLFTLLSMASGPQPPRLWPKNPPIEVSLVKDIAPEATAPPAPEPPAPSVAPETGEPEEAAPAPPPQPAAKPEPVKPAPPKPVPVKPTPTRPEPAKPATRAAPSPKPVPAPRPQPAKPTPAKPAPSAKPQPTAAAKATASAKPVARPSRLTGLASSLAAGAKVDAIAPRQRGHRLGDDILAGLAPDAPAKKASAAAPGKAGPFPAASIVGAIARQIQPCADRQVNPGPGASRIVTTLKIRLNRNGTLAATPTMLKQAGVDDENERYAQRVVDLGIAAFKGCTPLHLPEEYYDTAGGGWSNLNYRWQLR